MKSAVVTGASGFIGSSFVKYLINMGVSVLALGRKDLVDISEIRQHKIAGAVYLKIDMQNINYLNNMLQLTEWKRDVDCVFFNLAWSGRSSLSDLNVSDQIKNVWCSSKAVDIAKDIGCSCFIQMGTMEEAFVQKYLELNYHETNLYNRHVIYSVAKIAAKRATRIRANQLNINYIYILHSHVMGPDDEKNSFFQVTLQKLINQDELIFSSGEQYFDVISVKDCCIGYYLIGQKGLNGMEYWVGSGKPRPLKEYVEIMYYMYPSEIKMQFGKLPYNDVILSKDSFSIDDLVRDTGFFPTMTFEEIVKELHEHLSSTLKLNNK